MMDRGNLIVLTTKKRQKNVERCRSRWRTFSDFGNVHGCDDECGDIHGKVMGKNFSTIQSFIKNYEDLTLKQMFDVTAQLVNDQEEIHGLDKIQWEKDSRKRLSLIGDETVINLPSTKALSSPILCCASGESFNILIPTKLGRTELQESEPRKATEIMMLSMESWLNSSGTSSQDSQRCSPVVKSAIFWALWDKHQKLSQEEFIYVNIQRLIVTEKALKKNVWQMPESWKYLREDLVLDNGHLLVQVLKSGGLLVQRIVHKELGITQVVPP